MSESTTSLIKKEELKIIKENELIKLAKICHSVLYLFFENEILEPLFEDNSEDYKKSLIKTTEFLRETNDFDPHLLYLEYVRLEKLKGHSVEIPYSMIGETATLKLRIVTSIVKHFYIN